MKQYIYAHRGASGYAPENTLRAFDLAADMKADGVELDVQLTRDGEVVVIHDETVNRVTGMTGRVCEMTYAELQKLSVINAVDGKPTDRIPHLKDVLELLKTRGLGVNIELKNSVLRYPGMEEKVVRLVADTGMTDATIYSSFNHNSLQHVLTLNPDAYCGLLYSCVMAQPWLYAKERGMKALHPYMGELRLVPEEIELAHANGIEVNPWTVNSEEDLRLVMSMGADWTISNYPDLAREVLNSLNK